jgi:DNA-binding MarR family transcriptional regulator
MNYDKAMNMDKVEFGNMPPQAFLLGLLSAFDNRFQASAGAFFQDITWKQFFAIICIRLCREAPTLNDLSEVMGSSHQNVKQILLKLEKKQFIAFQPDEKDRRKQRIVLTDRCLEFCEKNNDTGAAVMDRMFNGITREELSATIQTITRIEKNLRGCEQ